MGSYQMLWIIFGLFVTLSMSDELNGDEERLQATLNALERTLEFFNENLDDIILDSIIGLRSVEGISTGLIAQYGHRMSDEHFKRLKQIQIYSEDISRRGVDYAMRNAPYYVTKMKFLINEHLWDFQFPRRRIPQNLLKFNQSLSQGNPPVYDEISNDDCFLELYQSRTCEVSGKCFEFVTDGNLHEYDLSHQLLYFILGSQIGCQKTLSNFVKKNIKGCSSVEDLMTGTCVKMSQELERIMSTEMLLSDGDENADLAMEIIGFCGYVGFLDDFAKDIWLEKILSWQSDVTGCFHQFPDEVMNPINFDPNVYGNYRRKRVEHRMTGKCLNHRSSVALNSLITYIKKFMLNFYE